MPCHRFKLDDGTTGFICTRNVYRYGGFLFEWHDYLGPGKLCKDGELAAREGKKFYAAVTRWCKLSKRRREKTRIG